MALALEGTSTGLPSLYLAYLSAMMAFGRLQGILLLVSKSRKHGCLILFFCGFFFPFHSLASWQDPLNVGEIETTAATVLSRYSTGATDQSTTSSLQDGDSIGTRRIYSASGTQHPLGVQVLSIELKEQKHVTDQSSRLAEVFLFNYPRAVTELHLVDVESSEVLSTRDIDSVHLPLSDAEISYTRKLIWSDAEFRERIQREFQSLNALEASAGVPVESADLQTRVSVWVPIRRQAHQCMRNRCALISLFTQDNHSFSIEPVIDLMSGEIYLDLVQ